MVADMTHARKVSGGAQEIVNWNHKKSFFELFSALLNANP